MTENQQFFFISTTAKDGKPLLYMSERFKFPEIDMINLIKICFVEGRNRTLGRKLLEIYRDSTEHRKELTEELLKNIGITENGDRNPTTPKNPKYK